MKLKANSVPSDHKQREQIVSRTGESIFVEASAGSGKTSILVDRMAAMVLEGTDIKKISAITYTNAAAKEFYERFQKKLGELAQKEKDPIRLERLTKASEDIDLCFMGTIDAFCSTILSEHPIDAGVPIGAHVLEEGEYAQAISREYQSIAKGEYGPELKQACEEYIKSVDEPQTVFFKVIKSRLEHMDNEMPTLPVLTADELQKKCSTLMPTYSEICSFIANNSGSITTNSSLDKWDKYNKSANHPALHKDAFSLTGTYLFDELIQVIEDIKSLNEIKIKGDISSMGISCAAKAWFIPSSSAKKWEDERAVNPSKTFPAAGTYTLDMRKCDCQTPLKVLNDEKYAIAMDFCLKACVQVEQKLRERGDLYFNTVLYYLRNMLRDDAKTGGKLIKHISQRHSHFLIDEFQDTDPIQSEIFFYLAAENPVEKWDECRARKGSLFIVGDPKQSIYSFKGSDEKQFNYVRDKFDDTKGGFGKVIVMNFNFRSSYKLCSWFDGKFTSLLGSKYPEILASADLDTIQMPAANVLDGCWSMSAQACGENETLALIKKLVNDPAYMLDDDQPRRIQYRDIMIITPEKKETDVFAAALKNAGIPVKVEGSVAYANNKVLCVLAKLMAAAADKYDDAALYNVLKSPLFSFTDERLAAAGWGDKARKKGFTGISLGKLIRETRTDETTKKKTYKYLDEKDDKDLIAAADAINSVRSDSYSMPASAVIQKAADDLKLLAKMGSEEMQLFYYAVELIRAGEISGEIASFKQAADKLGKLIASKPKANDRCLDLSEKPNAVFIANLHKVKGLQRPIVILGIMARNSSHSLSQALVYNKGVRKNVIFGVSSSKEHYNSMIIETNSFDDLKETVIQDRYEETARQNYVAATRAESALFICHKAEKKENADKAARLGRCWKALSVDDSGNVVAEFKLDNVPNVNRSAGADNGEQLYTDAQNTSSLNSKQEKLKATYIFESPNEKKIGSRYSGDVPSENSTEQTDTDSTAQAEPRRFASICSDNKGSLVHRLMELLVMSHTDAAKKLGTLIEQVIDELGEQLTQVQINEAKQMLESVADTMLNKGGFEQAGKAPQDLLGELFDKATAQIFCELPICYQSHGAIVYGIIDLLYVKNGKWHIIDYKTDRDAKGAIVKHMPQLEAYRRAVIKLKGEQIGEADIDANVYNINVN